MIKKLLKTYTYCATLFLIGCNPNIDFKETQQVSKNIEESQEKKTLIAEYVIGGIKKHDENIQLPVEKIWSERVWYLTLDSNGKQIFRVDTTKTNVVFQIKANSELNEKNYLKKWIIWSDDSSSTALLNERISVQPNDNLVPDSIFMTAYILGSSYNYKENLKPIVSFIAIRK